MCFDDQCFSHFCLSRATWEWSEDRLAPYISAAPKLFEKKTYLCIFAVRRLLIFRVIFVVIVIASTIGWLASRGTISSRGCSWRQVRRPGRQFIAQSDSRPQNCKIEQYLIRIWFAFEWCALLWISATPKSFQDGKGGGHFLKANVIDYHLVKGHSFDIHSLKYAS